ncbi:MAG: hypothetical protein J2P20_14520 [Pseudonocardia sp.]|nr:hypothetical protein [Pseudonocardia sp.]
MSKNSRRLLRASLAVAGMAVLCASFVGTAAAAPNATDKASDAQDSVGSDTPGDAANTPKVPDTKGLTGRGLLDNDVVSLESPKLKGISYTVPDFRAVPADSPGDNEDEDNLCHGTGGEQKLPGHNSVFQHPCQTHGNDIGGTRKLNNIPLTLPVSAELPGDDDTGNITQHGDKPAPLTDPGAVAKQLGKGETSLNKIENHHLAVTPV